MRTRVTRVYTQNLEFLWEFNSQAEASRMLGVCPGNIGIGCRHPYPMYLGLNWRYADDDELYAVATIKPDIDRLKILCKTSRHGTPRCAVQQLTLDGELIEEFKSAAEASRCVKSARYYGIIDCCKGTQHSCGGFLWRYAINDDEAKLLKSQATSERFEDGIDVEAIEGEIWKATDFCDKYGVRPYEVSNFGRVRKLGRYDSYGHYESAKLITQMSDHNGSVSVRLVNGPNGSVRVAVSRLVASAFIPNPDGLTIVRHIDGDSFNNRVENLAWCSRQELLEVAGATDKAAISHMRGVRKYTLSGELVGEFDSPADAVRDTGFSIDSIRWACRKRSKKGKSHGFVWRYTDNDELYDLSVPERKIAIMNSRTTVRKSPLS